MRAGRFKSYKLCLQGRSNESIDIDGTIEVKAASQKEAEDLVEKWMNERCDDGKGNFRVMQTVDPRIEWDDKADSCYEYADYTFNVIRTTKS